MDKYVYVAYISQATTSGGHAHFPLSLIDKQLKTEAPRWGAPGPRSPLPLGKIPYPVELEQLKLPQCTGNDKACSTNFNKLIGNNKFAGEKVNR